MHDLLVDELSRVTSVRVIPRTSVVPYRASPKPLPTIARESIAASIVRQPHTPLAAAERARLPINRPANPAAHEAYLKGVSLTGSFTPDGMARGIGYLEDAIQLDSTDPGAHRASRAASIVVHAATLTGAP
jgi:hypothetical protein